MLHLTMLKITSPYPYKEFKRKSVGGKRLYENPYGDPVPSVTTILSKTKDIQYHIVNHQNCIIIGCQNTK